MFALGRTVALRGVGWVELVSKSSVLYARRVFARFRNRGVIVAVFAVVVAGVAGFLIGHHGRASTVVSGTGPAYYTPGGGTARITSFGNRISKGFYYAVPKSVFWVDSTGAFHDHGHPPCLPYYKVSSVQMEATVVPNGAGLVVLVRC